MTNKIATIKERILHLLENKQIAKSVFFKKIGGTYGNFTGENKKKPIKSDLLANILVEIPDANMDWLLTGQGEMLKSNRTEIEKSDILSVAPSADNKHKGTNKNDSTQENSAIINALIDRLDGKSEEIGRLKLENEQLRAENKELKKHSADTMGNYTPAT